MKTINTEKYTIYIGNDFHAELIKFLAEGRYSSVFILADENTKKYCLKILRPITTPYLPIVITVKSGEKNKTIRSCEKIWRMLSKQNADRNSLLINLGGGVITDMGGFASSAYKRGIDFINMPTTLLAQADASTGGKTGIDFLNYKNQIGFFSFPKAVFINPDFLKTLNKRELISGFSEVIKHGLIADRKYWEEIKGLREVKAITSEIIFKSVLLKNEIVTTDPFENGLRKTLNFGHTIGHAIESASLKINKPLLHGEAIAIGMICEAYLSRKCCGLSNDDLQEISSFIFSVFSLKAVKYPVKNLLRLMKQDKKNKNEEINFTFLSSIGKAEINNSCSEKLIEESILFFNSACEPVSSHRAKIL